MVSRKPSVVMNAGSGYVRSLSAFVAVVLPCTIVSIASSSSSAASIAPRTPSARSRGVVMTLAVRMPVPRVS